MTIRIELMTAEGLLRGHLARSGHLRDVLEAGGILEVDGATWQPWLDGAASRSAGTVRLPIDDVLVAVGDDDPPLPVHAAWHVVALQVGPLEVRGELPTLPGYDPGRALARPSGEFVLLRDVTIGAPGGAGALPAIAAAHVNRYAVERVAADLMLGFFFPGAVMEGPAVVG